MENKFEISLSDYDALILGMVRLDGIRNLLLAMMEQPHAITSSEVFAVASSLGTAIEEMNAVVGAKIG